MTELQNNDLVSNLWAASPVEPTQGNQVNLSDNVENVSPVQAPLNEEAQVPNVNTVADIWMNVSVPVENTANSVEMPAADKPSIEITNTESIPKNTETGNTTNIPNNDIIVSNPVAPVKVENVTSNNVVSTPSVSSWAVTGNSINKVANATPQKVSDVSKRNPRTEYWKWLASGVLVSIWLVVISLVLFDNGSLLTSAANGIKLTDDDAANEVVKMEDALAFGDSLSNSYVDDIIGNSENEDANVSNTDNAELENQNSEDENIISDEILEDESDLDDTLVDSDEDEEADDNASDLIVEESDVETNIVAKNEADDEDSSLNTDKKSDSNSSKNKMAGSIVSIFDNTEEDLEADEPEDLNSSEDTSISYEHVNKVEDANWVMSANCDNLHCGDISEANLDDLVLCTEFRQSDKLDDNANRIGSNWVCRYKDVSELVHIEL